MPQTGSISAFIAASSLEPDLRRPRRVAGVERQQGTGTTRWGETLPVRCGYPPRGDGGYARVDPIEPDSVEDAAASWPDRVRELGSSWRSWGSRAERDRALGEMWILLNLALL